MFQDQFAMPQGQPGQPPAQGQFLTPQQATGMSQQDQMLKQMAMANALRGTDSGKSQGSGMAALAGPLGKMFGGE